MKKLAANGVLFAVAASLSAAAETEGVEADCPTENDPEVRTLGDGPPGMGTVASLGWLAGRWTGTAPDGEQVEEIWSRPFNGFMTGSFRWEKDGVPWLLEYWSLGEVDGVFALRLKHFGVDLKSWEEKDEITFFPLIEQTPCALYFDGMTLERRGEQQMRVSVIFGEGQTGIFNYQRTDP